MCLIEEPGYLDMHLKDEETRAVHLFETESALYHFALDACLGNPVPQSNYFLIGELSFRLSSSTTCFSEMTIKKCFEVKEALFIMIGSLPTR